MILLLGKNDLAEQFADKILKIDIYNDLAYYPDATIHYSEYYKELKELMKDNPPVVISQNIEFINYLLDSDLSFEVWTVYKDNMVRKLSKKDAINIHRNLGLELR